MKVFGADHKKNSLILRALLKLDLGKFLDCDLTFCNDSPEVLAVAKWGEGEEAAMLDLRIKNQSPIQYLQSLLAHLGLKLIGERKMGEKRQYSYKPEGGSLPADFSELYAAVSSKMLEKWEEKVQKKEAEKHSAVTAGTVASTSLEPIPPLPNISIDKVARGGMGFEENLEAPICQTEIEATSSELTPELAELPSELSAVEVLVAAQPWFQRGKEWIKCRVLEFVGDHYVLQAKSMVDDGLVRFRAFPEDLRWDTPV
jgi:hypothetical protein